MLQGYVGFPLETCIYTDASGKERWQILGFPSLKIQESWWSLATGRGIHIPKDHLGVYEKNKHHLVDYKL